MKKTNEKYEKPEIAKFPKSGEDKKIAEFWVEGPD